VLYRSAKQNPKRRFHALYDKLARSDVMWRAWVDVATNQGAPGIDGETIADIEAEGAEGVRRFLDALARELKDGTYRPKALRRVHIPKPGKPGETRPLGIPTVRDRVVMAAAKIVLEPIFEADFLPDSFGFRPKRSAHQALEVVRQTANKGRGVRGWGGLRQQSWHPTGIAHLTPAGEHRSGTSSTRRGRTLDAESGHWCVSVTTSSSCAPPRNGPRWPGTWRQ
jgi:hypothetical protein